MSSGNEEILPDHRDKTDADCNILPLPSVFESAGAFFFAYSAFALSIKLCLCAYSRSIDASFAAAVSFD